MKLNILPIRQTSGASVPISYTQDLSDLELFGEYPIRDGAQVEGFAENRADLLLAHLDVRYTVRTRCARCLKPLSIDRELELERVLVDSVEDEETLGDEEIVLNRRDRERIGEKLVKAANALLEKGRLSLAPDTRDIAGGLILRRGSIEANCSAELLVELSQSELSAKVAETLFA